jgi:hypothetical protein
VAAAKAALNGDPSELERLLVGRRIWVVVNPREGEKGAAFAYDCIVLSFNKFLPAGPVGDGEPHSKDDVRKKHLVKIWTDPGGTRVLTVGSIRMRDPGKTGEIKREVAATPA